MISVNGYGVTYDGNAHTATGTASGLSGTVNLSADLNLSGTTHIAANPSGYSDTWTFHDPNGNFADASGNVTDTIAQANAVIAVTGYSGTYDGSAHGATATATGVESPTPADLTSELHLAYSTDSGQTFSSAAPVNAGTYEVYYTFDGTGNYNAISSETDSGKAVRIAQAGSTVTVTLGSEFANDTVTYDSQAHGATASWASTGSDGAGGPLTVSYVGIDGTVYNASTTAPANAGTYQTSAMFTGDTDHTGSSGSANFTINAATPTVAVSGYTGGTYDDTAHTQTVTVTGVGGNVLYTTSLTETNAGSYSQSWSFSNNNYTSANESGTLSFSIAKANANISVTGYSVTYDGSAHTATYTLSGVNGETGATVGTVTLNTTHTNAGTYAADSWSFTGAANYNNIGSTTITDVISLRAVTLTGSETYNGSTSAAASILTVSNKVSGDTLTLSGSVTLASANAGTEAIKSFAGLSLGDSSASNYTLTGATGSVTVSPLAVTLTGSETYTGSTTVPASALTITNKVSGDTLTLSGNVTIASASVGTEAITSFAEPDAGRQFGAQLHVDGRQRLGQHHRRWAGRVVDLPPQFHGQRRAQHLRQCPGQA